MKYAWLLLLFAILYVAVVAPFLSVAYIDFGDGNYLYISRRVADGAVLYKDILAPQPPCHLLVGAGLIRLGRMFGDSVEHQLYTVRAFSILLHLLTMLLIWRLGLRLFRRESMAVWAAGLYMIIPLGFWWTLGYQSEPLELFFLLSSFLLLIRWRPGPMIAAGLLGVLAVCTNMTAVCYVGWIGLFLLFVDWRRALWYVLPVIGGAVVVVGVGEWLSGGHYLENVFFNQVGTFPHPDLLPGAPPAGAPLRGIRTILGYAMRKITSEGQDVLAKDGLFIFASICGLLLYLRGKSGDGERAGDAEPSYHHSFVAWYGFWSLMAIGFVSKGATMDYIFTIGEPFVCLFAGYAVVAVFDAFRRREETAVASRPIHESAVRVLLVVLLLIVVFGPAVLWVDSVVRRQTAYELDAKNVKAITQTVQQHSKPGDRILGPPYYAFIAERDLAEDFSELFIWQIKYGLEQIVDKTTGTATLKVNAIARALEAKELPVALVNKRPGNLQLYAIPPIRAALDANYESILREPVRTLNTHIDILVPKQ